MFVYSSARAACISIYMMRIRIPLQQPHQPVGAWWARLVSALRIDGPDCRVLVVRAMGGVTMPMTPLAHGKFFAREMSKRSFSAE